MTFERAYYQAVRGARLGKRAVYCCELPGGQWCLASDKPVRLAVRVVPIGPELLRQSVEPEEVAAA